MLSKNVQQAINEQINAEFSSSYTYLAMSIFCQRQNFLGCAHWLRIQVEEENGHGMRLLDFLLARDGSAELKSLAAPSVYPFRLRSLRSSSRRSSKSSRSARRSTIFTSWR